MKKIIVAITGASGAIYAQVLLQKLCLLREQVSEVALVVTPCGQQVFEHELGSTAWESLHTLPVKFYGAHDFFAPMASGSAAYHAMIVVPCSMGALSRIASGAASDLMARAADVMLKERRKLILVVRETPYHLIHLRNMLQVTEAGGIVCPASPSFYSRPATIEEVAATVVDRALQLAGLATHSFEWGATAQA